MRLNFNSHAYKYMHGSLFFGGNAMSNLYGEFAVTAGGRDVGSLHVTQEGLMTVYECTCDIVTNNILRLAAVSDEKYVPLGVMMPNEGNPSTLRLKKSFSKNALISMGLNKAETFHLICPDEVYTGCPEGVYNGNPETVCTCDPEPVYHNDPEPVINASSVQEPVESAQEMKPAAVNPELIKAVERMIHQLSSEPVKTEDEAEQPEAVPEPFIAEPSPAPTNAGTAYEEPEEERLPQYVPGQREAVPQPAYGGWRPIEKPSSLFNDETIAEACEEVSGALAMEQAGLTMLAVPVSPDAPFPMMPIFCFGSSEDIGGQEYIIFKIKNGYLSL
jgi:hypothetical protein